MRELNSVEVNAVSGAGFITDIGASLGQSIGAIVESTGKVGATNTGLQMGASIGAIVETSIAAFANFFSGLLGRK